MNTLNIVKYYLKLNSLFYLTNKQSQFMMIYFFFFNIVPLMSRLCPSDTYKVYKRGANVRIDTTLLGFDNSTWQRGNRSYIFKGLSKVLSKNFKKF